MKNFVDIGDRVIFLSPSGTRSRSCDWPENVWLENGIVGTVTDYHPAEPEVRVGNQVFEKMPAYAIVKFDNGATTCIDGDKEGRKRWKFV